MVQADPITRDALAIGVATGAYGVSYGVLAVAAGLTVAQTCAMSALVFTGASQFAVVGVLGAGGGVLAALAPALVLAARNARLRAVAGARSCRAAVAAARCRRSSSSTSRRRWRGPRTTRVRRGGRSSRRD